MALWDSLGETFTDFAGSVGDTAGGFLKGMSDVTVSNAKKAASAAPEENRTPIEQEAQQPTGAPVQSGAATGLTPQWLLYGAIGVATLGLFIALKK